MVQNIDSGPRIQGCEEQDGAKRGPMKLARAAKPGRQREASRDYPNEDVELIAGDSS